MGSGGGGPARLTGFFVFGGGAPFSPAEDTFAWGRDGGTTAGVKASVAAGATSASGTTWVPARFRFLTIVEEIMAVTSAAVGRPPDTVGAMVTGTSNTGDGGTRS